VTNSIQGIGSSPSGPDPYGQNGAGPPPDPTNLTERAVALARYEEFVAQGPASQCTDTTAPGFDFDRCTPVPVSDPVLFQTEAGDANAVAPSDIHQGILADCHLLASLGALASTPQGRALIQNAVVENKNAQGAVVSWTVTFHEPEFHLFGSTTFRDVPVTVAPPFGPVHASPLRANGQNEVWPLVFEKAYAQYLGGYNQLARGGNASDPMALLTGRDATDISLRAPFRWVRGYSADQLQSDLASGKLLVLSSRSSIGDEPNPDAHGLVGGHGYFVTGVEQRDGQLFVNMGNPWGRSQPTSVPFDELSKWFSRVTVGSVP
jgi:Calpain family cysteine protease